MASTAPTKGNLMAAKRSRALAENGWELMDRKRNILVRELMDRIERATDLQQRIGETFRAAYAALAAAEIVSLNYDRAVESVPEDDSARLVWRSVMGVDIPAVLSSGQTSPDYLPYTLADSSSALDEAYRRFQEVKGMLAELAEEEVSVYRIAFAIRKSQKRANALQNVVIPGLDSDISRIEQALAEKEREEFVRQKVVKARRKEV